MGSINEAEANPPCLNLQLHPCPSQKIKKKLNGKNESLSHSLFRVPLITSFFREYEEHVRQTEMYRHIFEIFEHKGDAVIAAKDGFEKCPIKYP